MKAPERPQAHLIIQLASGEYILINYEHTLAWDLDSSYLGTLEAKEVKDGYTFTLIPK